MSTDVEASTEQEIPTATIYKIESPEETDLIYIGATSKDINSRFSRHINNYKRYNEEKEFRINSCYELFDNFDNCKISIIDQIHNITKKELEKIERRYIEENRDICVNKNLPGSKTNEKFYCEICNKEINYYYYHNYHQNTTKHQKQKEIMDKKLRNIEEQKSNISKINEIIDEENKILDEQFKLLDEE